MEEKREKKPAGPSTLAVVVEAIEAAGEKKGASIPAIKAYMAQKYPDRSSETVKALLKKAISRGIETGVLVRPPSKDKDAGTSLTGRLRINKDKKETKHKKPTKSMEKSTDKTKTDKSIKTTKKPKTPLKKKGPTTSPKKLSAKAATKKTVKKKASPKKVVAMAKKTTPKAKAKTPTKETKTTPKAGSAKAKK